jgi:hypothetical protein
MLDPDLNPDTHWKLEPMRIHNIAMMYQLRGIPATIRLPVFTLSAPAALFLITVLEDQSEFSLRVENIVERNNVLVFQLLQQGNNAKP